MTQIKASKTMTSKGVRRVLVGLLILLAGWEVAHGVRSAWYEYHVFHGARKLPVVGAGAHEITMREVQFSGARGDTIRGWYVPSRNGATVILATGSESDRSSMWPYLRLFATAGFGVLLSDWPGTGTSDGVIGMGEVERIALQNSVTYALQQPDIREGRVGILGFSLGSYIGALAAADPRIQVLVMEGVFDNPWSQTRAEYSKVSLGARFGGLIGDYLAGLRPDDPRASDAIAAQPSRPLLFVAGTADKTVPLAVSRQIYDAANAPKLFWEITNAGHGDYLSADPTYGARLLDFMRGALLAPATDAPQQPR